MQRNRAASGQRGATIREHMTWRPPDYQSEYKQRYFAWTAGKFPAELQKDFERATMQDSAQRYPPIPAWLGQDPPLKTVFIPNGEILTYGPLGLHLITEPTTGPVMQRQEMGELWYRYTSDGYLLGRHDLGPYPDSWGPRNWRSLYADWTWLEEEMRKRGYETSSWMVGGGYRAYVERDKSQSDPYGGRVKSVIAAYDFQGNLVDPDVPLEAINGSVGQEIPQDFLKRIYEAQLALGITSADAQSPWEGTATGPQRTDPTPRPPTRVATRWPRGKTQLTYYDQEWVAIKPLEDPANPFREQYGPWDRWALEQFNRRNPREDEWNNARWARIREEQERERKEGKPVTPRPMTWEPYQQSADDPWQQLSMLVDEQGYLVPLLAKLSARAPQPGNPKAMPAWLEAPYNFSAGGVMPEQMRTELLQVLAREHPAMLAPSIPTWLEANPTFGFILLPSGEVITRGALGSWDGKHEQYVTMPDGSLRTQTLPANDGWYRYSLEGKPLGMVPSSASWQELVNPQWTSLHLSGKSQGYEVTVLQDYLVWRKPSEQGSPIVSAWDYDGSPIELTNPPLRKPGFVRYWRWGEYEMAKRGILNLN